MILSTRDAIPSPPLPTAADLDRISAADQQACRQLIDSWESPIKAIVKSYASRLSDFDDLMQVGRLAVYACALKYDVALGFPFSNYTKRAIKNCVMQEAARLARQRRLEASLEEHGDDIVRLNESVEEIDLTRSVKEWVPDLPEPHASIFRLLYVEQKKQREVAQEMEVSQPRVAQLHRTFLELATAMFNS